MSENNLPNEGMENEELVNNEENVMPEEEQTAAAEFEDNAEAEAEADEQENADEAVDEEAVEEAPEEQSYLLKSKLEKALKTANNFKTSAIVAWILVAVFACVDGYYFMTNIYNKYNHMGYYDVDGYTIGDVVASMGSMDFEEFKDMYGLPADMRKDTNLNAAQSLIKLSKMAELNGVDFAKLKEHYKFGDEITEDSTFGEGIDSLTIKDYLEMTGSEGNFEEFKTTYGISDKITEDSKWGEVRKIYEKQKLNERLAKENEKKNDNKTDDSTTGDSSNSADGTTSGDSSTGDSAGNTDTSGSTDAQTEKTE